MISLEYIRPEDMTDEDIRWLIESCKDSFDGVQPMDQVVSAKEGVASIFRVVGDAQGIVILAPSQIEHTLTITGLAGKGFLRHFDGVHKAILTAAAATGARKVNGYVTRRGLAALYQKRTNAKLVPMFIEDVLS